MTARSCLAIAGIVGALGITVGAFGAHSLPGILAGRDVPETEFPQRKAWLETGSRYHLMHAVALLALAMRTPTSGAWPTSFTVASMAWLVGILVFSGGLYAMAFTGLRVLGAIVPIGGVAFIIGWMSVAVGALWPS